MDTYFSVHRIFSTRKCDENCHSFALQQVDWPCGGGEWGGREEEEQEEAEDEDRGQMEVEMKRQRGQATQHFTQETLEATRIQILIMLQPTRMNIAHCPLFDFENLDWYMSNYKRPFKKPTNKHKDNNAEVCHRFYPTWCRKRVGIVLHGEHSIINIAETEHREMDSGRRLACDTSKRALQLSEGFSFPPDDRLEGIQANQEPQIPSAATELGRHGGLEPLNASSLVSDWKPFHYPKFISV